MTRGRYHEGSKIAKDVAHTHTVGALKFMDHYFTYALVVIAFFRFWDEPMLSITPQPDLVAELGRAMTELRKAAKNA